MSQRGGKAAAAKGKKPAAKAGNGDEEREDALQAVVSTTKRLSPYHTG